MKPAARATTLAPFQFRAFRFQWPADLATSCAFEMETLILSWYILVETQSVFWLTAYASLQYLGTLVAPMIGVVGDRIGARYVLSAMRAIYATLAFTLLVIILIGAVSPVYVFIIGTLMGLVRPSDMGMRVMLIGNIVPAGHLVAAIGIQRTSFDASRVTGALAGAGIAATLGLAPAYVAIAVLYTISACLTFQARSDRPAHSARPDRGGSGPEGRTPPSPWRELKEGARYVWTTPILFASMCLAFMINLTAFPLLNGLQPYVAREIYGTTQTGLGYMSAAAGFGALVGSIVASRFGSAIRPARTMIVAFVLWFLSLLFYTQTSHIVAGIPFLFAAGLSASMSQVPMQAMILRLTNEQFRGRVMGIRMLAIYGNMLGLLVAGPLIAWVGYRVTGSFYCLMGILVVVLISMRWHEQLWRRDAPANQR